MCGIVGYVGSNSSQDVLLGGLRRLEYRVYDSAGIAVVDPAGDLVSAKKAGKGAGMFAGAAVGGHFVLLFLSLALMWALGSLMPLGWAALIVAVLWGIVAAVLAAMGKKEMKQVKGLPQTAETIKEIPPTLKPGEQTR